MRSFTVLALGVVLAAPVPAAAQINPAPLPRTPVGQRPVVPPNLNPVPRIDYFSSLDGVTSCVAYGHRPLLKYHVSGGVQSVVLTHKLSSGKVIRDVRPPWSSPVRGGEPEHTELAITDETLSLDDAAQLEGYLIQVIGNGTPAGVSSQVLPFSYRPPMSLRILGSSVTRTMVGGTPAAPVMRYQIAAAYRNLTAVTVQGRPATGAAAKPLVWNATFAPAPLTDRARVEYGSETTGAISWTYDWSGHTAAQIAAPMHFTFTPEQNGPCGRVTGPPQGPVPGA
jgi:hypothetical protein